MKKYIKPTAEVVELSVKESLSDLPAGITHKSFVKTQKTLAATYYTLELSKLNPENT